MTKRYMEFRIRELGNLLHEISTKQIDHEFELHSLRHEIKGLRLQLAPPPTPNRDRRLAAMIAMKYVGQTITLEDGDTLITGVCTGFNNENADLPLFEIDGVLREGIPEELS